MAVGIYQARQDDGIAQIQNVVAVSTIQTLPRPDCDESRAGYQYRTVGDGRLTDRDNNTRPEQKPRLVLRMQGVKR